MALAGPKLTSIRTSFQRLDCTARSGTPSGCGSFLRSESGGVAALNPRLRSLHPFGMKGSNAAPNKGRTAHRPTLCVGALVPATLALLFLSRLLCRLFLGLGLALLLGLRVGLQGGFFFIVQF